LRPLAADAQRAPGGCADPDLSASPVRSRSSQWSGICRLRHDMPGQNPARFRHHLFQRSPCACPPASTHECGDPAQGSGHVALCAGAHWPPWVTYQNRSSNHLKKLNALNKNLKSSRGCVTLLLVEEWLHGYLSKWSCSLVGNLADGFRAA
jgi:hypothetical protein